MWLFFLKTYHEKVLFHHWNHICALLKKKDWFKKMMYTRNIYQSKLLSQNNENIFLVWIIWRFNNKERKEFTSVMIQLLVIILIMIHLAFQNKITPYTHCFFLPTIQQRTLLYLHLLYIYVAIIRLQSPH